MLAQRMTRAVTEEIERLLGYAFRSQSLLAEALTHSSYPDHRSYHRLEFVGDAALSLAITKHLYLTNPDLGPGRLSALRAANISTEKLARVAVCHRLYRFLRRNSHALDQMVFDFTNLVMMEREEEIGWAPYGGSTVKAPKVLADIVESIAAAVYVDCNFDLELLWKVLRGILEPIITSENMDEQPVTTLYELCQKQGRSCWADGPYSAHIKNWKRGFVNNISVFIDGDLMGIGCSEQRSIAKLNAARDALQKLSALEEADMDVELSSTAGNGTAEEKDGSKQKLNQFCSKKHWIMPIYKIEKEEGPAHCKRFICSVQVETEGCTFITFGDPKSRVKDAENSAASKMLADILVGR
ncbi:unnamed protein product [Musa acuminata subsp. burmannicoides]